MKLLNAYIANIKRLIKTPKVWGPFIVTPAIIFLLLFFVMTGASSNTGTYGLVIEDKGEMSREILEVFEDEPIVLNKEEAIKELKEYNLKLVYLIDENFSKDIKRNVKPKITKLFIEDPGYQIEDSFIDDKIKELMEENYLKDTNLKEVYKGTEDNININIINHKTDVDFSSYMVILVISYIVILLAGNIGMDIIQLIRNRVFSRILSSPNSNTKTMMGLFLSYLTLISLALNIMALLGYKMLDEKLGSPLYLVVSITAIVAFTLSLVILLIRYTQNESMITIIPLLIAMATFLSEIAYMTQKTSLPSFIGKLMYINPLFWIQRVMETSNFINIIPIMLMSLVLLTFGSYKLENIK